MYLVSSESQQITCTGTSVCCESLRGCDGRDSRDGLPGPPGAPGQDVDRKESMAQRDHKELLDQWDLKD